jgi:hypothetical protein
MEMDGTNDAINGLLASWDLGPGSGLDIIGAERRRSEVWPKSKTQLSRMSHNSQLRWVTFHGAV